MLFQDICVEKYNWNDELNGSFINENFKNTDSIIFDRKYCFSKIDNPIVNIQLHGFNDASLRASGCYVYLCIERNCGFI